MLEKVLNRRYKSVRTLIKHMRKDVGRIHRYGIENGLNIFMTPTFDGEARIEARDPLLSMPSSYDAIQFGPPLEGPKTGEILLDGFDFRGVDEVIDPMTVGLPRSKSDTFWGILIKFSQPLAVRGYQECK